MPLYLKIKEQYLEETWHVKTASGIDTLDDLMQNKVITSHIDITYLNGFIVIILFAVTSLDSLPS